MMADAEGDFSFFRLSIASSETSTPVGQGLSLFKMEDNSATSFFNSYFLSETTPTPSGPEKDSRLSKNLQLVHKFLGESEERKASTYSGSFVKDKLENLNAAESSQDALAYSYFDKLWISSKHHQSLLFSQWHCLLEKIKQQGQEFNQFNLGSNHVSGMLYLCKTLNTNFIIRFRALELYNRYLKQFTRRHTEFLVTCKEQERKEFKARFESQVFLRMCTCIMIASKLHADTQIRALTTEKIKRLLSSEGFEFSCNNIARSEMRVMETLDYRCLWVTPLELVEQLLSILNLQLEFLKRAHYFCILLLEYCYSDLENIRGRFSISIKKSQRLTVSAGEITVPLMCAGIVAAALFIVSAETKVELHKVVAKTANLNEEDVHILAVLLLDLLNVSS